MIPLALIAAFPFFIVLALMVGLRWPAVKAMPATLLLTVVVALTTWQLSLPVIGFAIIKGILTALSILYIIASAIFLLRVLEHGGAICVIDRMLGAISRDRRIQAILIAWLFGSFIEGAAGFGTPQAIIAPLLLSLGFPALAAVIIAVLSNSTSVSFGAAGVPVTFGIGSVAPELVGAVTIQVALIHGIIGIFVPLMLVIVMTRLFGGTWREGSAVWPFALFAGISFTLPFALLAIFVSAEIASIGGALIAMLIVIPSARRGFLMPRTRWDFPPRAKWMPQWIGSRGPHEHKGSATVLTALLPYLVVAVLLVVTRIKELGIMAWLQGFVLTIPLGADSFAFQYLYSPGTIFIIGSIVAILVYKSQWTLVRHEVPDTILTFRMPLVALSAAIATVQVILATAMNTIGLPSMPVALAGVATVLGKAFMLASPFVGILGAFIAGSNTVSNLLFGPFQLQSALAIGLAPALVLSLQTVGGAAGNMIAIHNVISASATTGLHHREADVIRATIVPCLLYGLFAACIGMVIALL